MRICIECDHTWGLGENNTSCPQEGCNGVGEPIDPKPYYSVTIRMYDSDRRQGTLPKSVTGLRPYFDEGAAEAAAEAEEARGGETVEVEIDTRWMHSRSWEVLKKLYEEGPAAFGEEDVEDRE